MSDKVSSSQYDNVSEQMLRNKICEVLEEIEILTLDLPKYSNKEQQYSKEQLASTLHELKMVHDKLLRILGSTFFML